MPLVVSVTVMSDHAIVIGGLHGGCSVAVTVRLKYVLPFWTGKSPAAEKVCLFAACGLLPPGFTHCAVALSTMWTWASSPRPASLPLAVTVSPELVAWT